MRRASLRFRRRKPIDSSGELLDLLKTAGIAVIVLVYLAGFSGGAMGAAGLALLLLLAAFPAIVRRIAWAPLRGPLALGGWICLAAIPLCAYAPLDELALFGAACFVFRSKIPKPGDRPKTSWKALVASGILLAASLAISLGAVEIGARLLIEAPKNDMSYPTIFEADPDSLYTVRPNAMLLRKIEVAPNTVNVIEDRISPQGLRGPYVPPEKPAGEIRVLLLGDSYTFGGSTPIEDTIASQLQAMLNDRFPDGHVRVINLGLAGSGPWQQRARLNKMGFALQPDVVVHQLYLANDVGNTLTATEEHLEACNPEWEYSMQLWRMHRYWRFWAENWLQTRSWAYGRFRRIVGREGIVNYLARGTRVLPAVAPPVLPQCVDRIEEMEVNLTQWYPKLERGWERLLDDVSGTAADCKERKVGYAVYNIPFYLEESDGVWNAESEPSKHGVSYERYKIDRMISEAIARRGYDSFSLVQELHGDGNPADLYFTYDLHLSRKANAIVARHILRYLDTAGWLRGGGRPATGS